MQSADRMPRMMGSCAMVLLMSAAALAAGGQSVPAKTKTEARSASQLYEANWWKNAVIYEIYPRSFQDSNGDGLEI
jgi:hypothetical protein